MKTYSCFVCGKKFDYGDEAFAKINDFTKLSCDGCFPAEWKEATDTVAIVFTGLSQKAEDTE